MEQGLLLAVSLLPLGLVAVAAYLMLTRKKKQAPKLEIVPIPDAPSMKAVVAKPQKTRKNRKPTRGKRK